MDATALRAMQAPIKDKYKAEPGAAMITLRALTLRGSYVGSQSDMAELLDLVKRTGMPPVPIKTRPLEEVNATLNDLRAGKIVGRVVLTPAA